MVDFEDLSCPTLEVGRFGPLPGSIHTVPRAELYAALYALQNSRKADVRLVSDSKYFVDSTSKHLNELILTGNGELWEEYFKEAEKKDSVTVIKVKAHGSDEQLISGTTSWRDYAGNAYADLLAIEGAVRAALPAAILLEVDYMDQMAFKVQQRLIAVVCASDTREQDKKDAAAHKRKRDEEYLQRSQEENLEAQRIAELERDLGPVEVPMRLGGAKSSLIHDSHRVTAHRGILWCETCGAYASSRGRGLLHNCLGFPTETGREVLRRVRLGLTPHYSVSYDE